MQGIEVNFRLIQHKTWPITQIALEETKEKTNKKKGQLDEEM
jgi:hypothetical protein